MAWTLFHFVQFCWWKRLKVSHCVAAPEEEKKTIKRTEQSDPVGLPWQNAEFV